VKRRSNLSGVSEYSSRGRLKQEKTREPAISTALQESRIAKIVSLIIKFGALVFAGIVASTAMAPSQSFRPIYPVQIGALTIPCYAARGLADPEPYRRRPDLVFNAIHAVRGEDETRAEHYV
jgi:hypothetical protein